MTTKEKRAFIKGLMRSVQVDILAKVPLMPAGWDGHELREYIADQFERERTRLMKESRGRKRDYQNEVITTNL